jgi:thymidine phosphorylase
MIARTIIDRFANSQTSENMKVVIEWAKSEVISDDDIIYLTYTLANSGKLLKLPDNSIGADIPSTGGPASLSTLLCPLVLKELGFIVPKLGVIGRPAGGIDVLAQIPGYKIEFNYDELSQYLKSSRYCHFLAGNEFVPLDAILFKYRSSNNAKAIYPLVIASILSKKIAVGLKSTGLDVRVAKYGNFGTNWDEAKKNSLRFIQISKRIGINAVCFLNDINNIQQPYIGRGESLVSLYEIFYGEPDDLLENHLYRCISMGYSLSPIHEEKMSYSINILLRHFIENISSQGSSEKAFIMKVNEIKSGHIYKIQLPKSGFLNIDLMQLRDTIVWGQNKILDKKISDPCGVIFKKYSNAYVDKDETILTYRVDNRIKDEFHHKLMSAVSINSTLRSDLGFEKII